ncbi:MAG: hypothetical protein RLZ98_375 [Pseudomonadota bacterium]|jgi:hypothetical protein
MTDQPENKGGIQPAVSPGEGFAGLLLAAEANPLPPVESWNPPYCGDVGFEIRRDGTWFYRSSPIGRRRLVKLFSRILRRDPDGCHYLVTPVEKVLVHVEDAPFLAVEMEVSGAGSEQQLSFRTNVDDVVRCDSEHPLRFAADAHGGLKPYLRVRGGLDALATRAVAYELMGLVVERDDKPGLWSGGVWFEVS